MKKCIFPFAIAFSLLITGSTYSSNLASCAESNFTNHCFYENTYENGDKYAGEWKNRKMHGHGKFSFANGDIYVGGFANGVFDGQGIYTFAEGSRYVGEWGNGKFNGHGIFTNKDGIAREGLWRNGEFQFAKKLSKNSKQIAVSSDNDVEILNLRLSCKTKPGTIIDNNFSNRSLPEQEVFVTLKLFDLANPFQTEGVAKFQITQKASISIEGNVFYTTHEMVGNVGDATKPNLITVNEEKFSFINAQSKYSPGKWIINIDRITGLVDVMGMKTSSMVNMVTYKGKCKKIKNKKMF